MRIPIPKLKEKNACPIARTMTWGVIFEKSGCRKNFSPSLASGSVNDRIQKNDENNEQYRHQYVGHFFDSFLYTIRYDDIVDKEKNVYP